MTNEELLQAYVAGNEAAFTELVEACLPIAYRYASRELGDHQQAEDVCQIVFSSLAGLGKRSAEIRSVSAWVFASTRRQIALMIRKESRRRKREQTAAELADVEETGLDLEVVLPSLRASLAELPRRDQNALFLRYYEGQSFRQVGDSLGIREHAAQKRVHRAVERLQGLLSARGVTSIGSLLGAQLFTAGASEMPVGLSTTIASQAIRQPIVAIGGVGAFLSSALFKGMLALGGIVLLVVWPLVKKGELTDSENTLTAPTDSTGSLLSNLESLAANAEGFAIDDIERIYQLAPTPREAALVRLISYLEDKSEEAYLVDLFQRWTRLDPQRNANAIVTLIRSIDSGDARQTLLAPMLDIPLHVWASKGREAAFTWVLNLPRTDYAEAFAHESLLRYLVGLPDLKAAYQLLTSRGLVRSGMIDLLAEALVALPPSDALRLLDQWEEDRSQLMPSERERNDLQFRHEAGDTKRKLMAAVVPRLYSRDTEAVVAWLEALPSARNADELSLQVIRHWAGASPESAVQWVTTLPEPASEPTLQALLEGWSDTAAQAALDWGMMQPIVSQDMLREPLRALIEHSGVDLAKEWLDKQGSRLEEASLFVDIASALPPLVASRWAEELTQIDHKTTVLRQAFYRFGQQDMAAGRQELAAYERVPPEVIEAFALGVFVSHGRKALTGLTAVMDGDAAIEESLAAAEVTLLGSIRPSLAYSMVRARPPGDSRDRLVTRLLEATRYRSLEDSDDAEQWAMELLTGATKADAIKEIKEARVTLKNQLEGIEIPQVGKLDFANQSLSELEAYLATLARIPSRAFKRK